MVTVSGITSMTGGIANREENGLVFCLGFDKCFIAPRKHSLISF